MRRVLMDFAVVYFLYFSISTAYAEALPLALLGKAPPLQGQRALHYFADNRGSHRLPRDAEPRSRVKGR